MKIKILLFAVSIALLANCANKPKEDNNVSKLGEKSENDCILTGLDINYENYKESYRFTLDESDRVIVSERFVDDFKDRTTKVIYEGGKIVKLELYNDSLTSVMDLKWVEDSLEVIVKDPYKDMVATDKFMALVNENGEVTRIFDYTKDSVGNWVYYGSGYSMIWENGIEKMRMDYVFKLDSLAHLVTADDYTKEQAYIINNNVFIFEGQVFYDDHEVELFCTTEYTYDDKKNPNRKSSIASIISLSNHNLSINNPIKVVKTYETKEALTFDYKYEYNDKEYPIKATIGAVFTADSIEVKRTSYTIDYIYK